MTADTAAMRVTMSHPVLFPLWFKAGNFGGVVYQPPHKMRRAGGTAASERRYPASIHAVCLEKPLAAVPGLVSAAIFSHIWWRTVSVPNLYLHSINTRSGAPPDV